MQSVSDTPIRNFFMETPIKISEELCRSHSNPHTVWMLLSLLVQLHVWPHGGAMVERQTVHLGGAGSAALVVHWCGRRRHQTIDRHLAEIKRDFDLHLLRRMINTFKECKCAGLQHSNSWLAGSPDLFTFNCTLMLEWREGPQRSKRT